MDNMILVLVPVLLTHYNKHNTSSALNLIKMTSRMNTWIFHHFIADEDLFFRWNEFRRMF